MRVGHEAVGAGVEDDGKTIVGDIPNKFIPTGGVKVFGEMGGDTGTVEVGGDGAETVGGATPVFAEPDVAVVEVLDMAGRDFVGAEETESADDTFRADDTGSFIFVARPFCIMRTTPVSLMTWGRMAGRRWFCVVLRQTATTSQRGMSRASR